MDLLIAGLAGVVIGAAASAGTALLLLRRSADRDLIERRMKALVAYREILGRPVDDGALRDPAELDQAVHDVEACAREFRLTAWIFDEPLRREIARPLSAVEDEVRRSRARGERPPPVAVVAALRELDAALRRAAGRCLQEHRRWRAWPLGKAGPDEEDSPDIPALPPGEAEAPREDAAVR